MGNTNPNFIPLSLTSLQRVLKPSQNPSLFSSFFHFQTSMSNMQFWGVEVKAGEPLKVEPDDNTLLHLSQAALGEPKKDKGSESVVLSATVNGQKLVIGTLSTDKCPQISYDLVFEKEFELSHNWKNGSVFFCGYKADAEEEGTSDGENMFGDDSEFEEEEIPVVAAENGKHVPKVEKAKASDDKAKAAKPVSAAAKPKDMLEASDDSDEDSSEEEEEEEATPENAKQSKKRPAVSATKTSAPEKKAKLVTPQKSGGDAKKGNTHTATPHPSKQAAKTKGSADKSKQQTPKSAGQVSCKSCSKTFNSDGALQSHTKAKHSDGK
ncbi:hypothetical protein AQUCO_00900987v1 [Aquilegia coerulea]|uniref:C2H2-type domain-containing protein n=1 Tax=Aquilegia coerulea TaxID=218851 RepID=A0A2G5EGD8_AQUCA|nr:hypothetical protein AQUCO_00900987v1 [Aquilegia coerulea]